MSTPLEVRRFIDLVQQQYSEALEAADRDGMFETSYTLTRAYAAIGNLPLAGRWACECEKHTQDPNKIFTLNMILLCGIIKHKYLASR